MTVADIFESFCVKALPCGTDAEVVGKLRLIARQMRLTAGSSAQLEAGGDHYVYLACGTAKLVAHGSGSGQQVISFHFAGELMLVPAPSQNGFTFDAITPCELLVFKASEALEVANADARFAVMLLERMTAALASAREVSITLGRKRAYERVASFLLAMREREPETGTGEMPVKLQMSRRDIGDNLAITVESISREIARLRSDHVIETPSRGKVRVLDSAKLARRAGFFAVAK